MPSCYFCALPQPIVRSVVRGSGQCLREGNATRAQSQENDSQSRSQPLNWFQTGDIQRGRGEALSIRQMVEKIVIDKDIDRRRVFITGLSAGGAMTSVMLAS